MYFSSEWDKHGTCAESLSSLSTQHAYFEAALQLRKQADTLGRLEDAGIRPSNTTTYSLDDLNKAVSGYAADWLLVNPCFLTLYAY